jgi:glycosyltransferase involved in cell wall biosynthesis
MMNICIVIPVHNEAQFIGPLVESLGKKEHDVIVIDDGSTDQTSDIARDKGAIVIRHQQRSGKGFSLREGFEYVLNHGYDGVVTMDGDGQHDVNDLDQFVKAAQKCEACIIAGNRMNNTKVMPLIRYCTNRFMSWLISMACGQSIGDTQCGYRYISRNVLAKLSLTCKDFEIETEILMQACKKGFKVYSVPIKAIYSDEKSKINPFMDTIRFFAYFLKEIRSSKI